ncbi:hypothetical protein ACFSHT_08980 [Paraburkholderia silviterrae]|uniref:Uncharacterized protein n=1 Tax=Paraburkholderia silviterrae TaxID=2528715 RepID=A0A4R5MDF7_9BURK|nr:hypothetical protein [Paraburkholderia silviterrae]TDG25126.1 hypothetical protein EYW47_04490 [Paraburkholderia silviterrae]
MSLILGAALAGGAEGAGKSANTGLQSMQEQEQKLDLVKLQEQLDTEKELRIAEQQHGFRTEEQGAQFTHESEMQSSQQTFLKGEGEANRSNAVTLGKLQVQGELGAASIHAGAELGAARLATQASMANARLMAAAKSIQTLGDGRIVAIGIDPGTLKQTVNPLMDPNDPNKPLMGMKNLDQRTVLLAQSLMSEGSRKIGMGDTAGAGQDFQAARQVLTTGQLPPTDGKAPSMQSVQYLLDHPETAAQFDAQFGAGQASKALAAGGKTPGAAPDASGQTVSNPFAPSAAAAVSTAATQPAPAASSAPAAPTAPAGSTITNVPQPGQLGSGLALGNDPTGLITGNMNY